MPNTSGREPVIIQDKGAPYGWGILGIIQELPEQSINVVSGCDYYWHYDGRWFGGDIAGMLDYLAKIRGILIIGRKDSGIATDCEYYWEDNGERFGGDFGVMLQHMVEIKRVIMVGRMIRREKYLAAMRHARLSWDNGHH